MTRHYHFSTVFFLHLLCFFFVFSASFERENRLSSDEKGPGAVRFISINQFEPLEDPIEMPTYSGVRYVDPNQYSYNYRRPSTPSPSDYLKTTAAKEYFQRLYGALPSQWLVNSFSLCDRPAPSLISNEFTKKTEISSVLTNYIISSNPLVEFLVHRPDSIASLSNYPAIHKIAFYATFPTSQLDSEVFSSILVALEQDFYLSGMFLTLSVLNCGDGTVEVAIFTNIENIDYETMDRLVHSFSRFPLLRDFTPNNASEVIQKRIFLMRSGGVKKSSDLIWQKVKGLFSPKSSPKSRSTVSTKSSPDSVGRCRLNSSPRSFLEGILPRRRSSSASSVGSSAAVPPSIINPDLLENFNK